jgi:membrane protein implicated in regulation of membrane protease activity
VAVAVLLSLPLILKGIVFSMATIMAALVLAGVFMLGVSVALAVTSPLWIPFLAGWAAVKFCQKYYKDGKPEEKLT